MFRDSLPDLTRAISALTRPILLLFLCLGLSSCAMLLPERDVPAQWMDLQGPTPKSKVTLYYEAYGTHGSPILLLHGFAGSTYSWNKVIPRLEKNHRVIAVDMKGFGRSDKPMDGHYSLYDQTDLISQFIDKLDLRDLTVVGHSMGGGVALMLAIDEVKHKRGRINKLIKIGSPALDQTDPTLVSVLDIPILSPLVIAIGPPELISQIGSKLTHPKGAKTQMDEVLHQARQFYEPGGKYALLKTAWQLYDIDVDSLSHEYAKMSIPTLLLWCDNDHVVPLSVAEQLDKMLPNSHIETLKGCGHAPQYLRPRELSDAIARFAR